LFSGLFNSAVTIVSFDEFGMPFTVVSMFFFAAFAASLLYHHAHKPVFVAIAAMIVSLSLCGVSGNLFIASYKLAVLAVSTVPISDSFTHRSCTAFSILCCVAPILIKSFACVVVIVVGIVHSSFPYTQSLAFCVASLSLSCIHLSGTQVSTLAALPIPTHPIHQPAGKIGSVWKTFSPKSCTF